MGKRIPKGWTLNGSTRKYDYKVFNSAGAEKTVFDEDGVLYHQGSALTQYEQSVLFTEAGAGTYTGTVSLPAGAVIQDVIVHAIALWAAATSAAMTVGDADDPNGFFDAVNLKATDLLAGESINFTHTGGKEGADLDDPAAGAHVRRRYLATARSVTGKIVSVGAGTTGRTLMTVIYAVPSPTAAVKT